MKPTVSIQKNLQFAQSIYSGSEAKELFLSLANERGMTFYTFDNWATDWEEFPKEIKDKALAGSGANYYEYLLIDHESALVNLYLGRGLISVYIAAEDYQIRDALMENYRELIPEVKVTDDKVTIHFWNTSSNGPRQTNRRLEVPHWKDISENYVSSRIDELDWLFSVKGGDNLRDGRLILWQGLPGTGKTYAIRALAREWSEWADLHFIIDPDKFFGDGPDYLMNVIMDENKPDRWKVLVLEDSGELLAADAKQKSGQGLSRLLNMVDGMLGQGLKFIVLVTTNEELKNLHEAVIRNGRCASQLCFESFSPDQANKWLSKRGYSGDKVTKYHTVSELYALLNGAELKVENKNIVGFIR